MEDRSDDPLHHEQTLLPLSYISLLWCIKPPPIVLDCVCFQNDRTDTSVFMEIQDKYHDYVPVHTDGSQDRNPVACATVLSSDTIISIILLYSASVFTAKIWEVIKTLEQIKDYFASKCIIFTCSLSCLQDLQYMKLEHPFIGMVIQKCVLSF